MRKSLQVMICIALMICWALPFSFSGHSDSSGAAGRGEKQGELLRRAQAALKQGDAQGAIQAYEKLVKAAPRSAEFLYGLGAAYYEAGRPQDAIETLQGALKLKPGIAEASYVLGASLAESGQCAAALTYLQKPAPDAAAPALKRAAGADGLRCAMELDREHDAVKFLWSMEHDFPKDPEVLYLATHAFSDLSTRASQKLLVTNPASYQARELSGEAWEAQGKWKEAEQEYERVLEIHPNLAGIHYRIGRDLLSEARKPENIAKAKEQFEDELKIDPRNAGAEYVLGVLAQQDQDWPLAIEHFRKAARLDPQFADAFAGLGRALLTSGDAAGAVTPLETAVRLQPADPSSHYLLSSAYRRTGKIEDANRELAAYRKAQRDAQRQLQDIRAGVLGRKSPAQESSQRQP